MCRNSSESGMRVADVASSTLYVSQAASLLLPLIPSSSPACGLYMDMWPRCCFEDVREVTGSQLAVQERPAPVTMLSCTSSGITCTLLARARSLLSRKRPCCAGCRPSFCRTHSYMPVQILRKL